MGNDSEHDTHTTTFDRYGAHVIDIQATPKRLTAKGKLRRAELIDFAARRFAEQGYHPTSVAELCEGIGVGKGVFYWYFPSKEALFVEILTATQRDLRRYQQSAIGDEADPVRQIEQGIKASMEWYDQHRYVVTLFQFAYSEDTWASTLKLGAQVAVADVARIVQRGIDDGQFQDADPTLIAHALIGVMEYLSREYLADTVEHRDAVVRAATNFCLRGVIG